MAGGARGGEADVKLGPRIKPRVFSPPSAIVCSSRPPLPVSCVSRALPHPSCPLTPPPVHDQLPPSDLTTNTMAAGAAVPGLFFVFAAMVLLIFVRCCSTAEANKPH